MRPGPRTGMNVVRADTFRTRLRGLGLRASLPADEALLMPRCRSVHTFTMRFALDLIWLDSGGRVVRVDRAVARGRMRACRRAACCPGVPCRGGRPLRSGGVLAEPGWMPELAEL